MKKYWDKLSSTVKNGIGVVVVAMTLVVGSALIVHPAISQLVGLAVAVTTTQWNSVADAAKGDGLSSGIMAQSPYLFNGLTFDRQRSAPAADAVAGTGFMGFVLEVFNGTTYDRARGSLAADALAVTGIQSAQLMGLNTAGTQDRVRVGLTADGVAGTGLVNPGNYVFNASTWDRQRTASGDGLVVTGMTAAGNMGWNGASFDRLRTASATTNTETTSLGIQRITPASSWNITNTTTGATAATATKASGGGSVRHVATTVTVCHQDSTINAVGRVVDLLDGAAKLRSWVINGAQVAGGAHCESISGLNITGSAATAMSVTFAANPSGTATETVNLTGYSTP